MPKLRKSFGKNIMNMFGYRTKIAFNRNCNSLRTSERIQFIVLTQSHRKGVTFLLIIQIYGLIPNEQLDTYKATKALFLVNQKS